ncbi:hypothetical protein [Streptomyces sp. NPDC060205]|uniref:hypothetical protein n=1 Tax=Streptomyces sp. NPDC060205 TaxID=3347072 RepID=UPI00365E195B
MSKMKGSVGLIGMAAGVAGLLLATAPAGEAATAKSAADPKACVVLVGKTPAEGGASPELYRYCSDKSAADARAHLASSQVLAKTGGKSAQATLLMLWSKNTDYRNPTTFIYGDDGPCDSSGYSLHPDDYWSHNISSAQGVGTCTVARFHNRSSTYAATFRLPVPYLGASLNDNVGLIQVWRG